MSQQRKQRFFYNHGRLSSEVGNNEATTLLSAIDLPLAERSIETLLLAANTQSSIVGSFYRDHFHNLIYTPYGHSQVTQTLGFTGQCFDRFTHCYLLGNGYRSFNPRLMRLSSPDIYSPLSTGGLNAYAYCAADPINYIDPSGRTRYKTKGFQNTGEHRDAALKAIKDNPTLTRFKPIAETSTDKKILKKISRIAEDEPRRLEIEKFVNAAVQNLDPKLRERFTNKKTGEFEDYKILDVNTYVEYFDLYNPIKKSLRTLDSLLKTSQPGSTQDQPTWHSHRDSLSDIRKT